MNKILYKETRTKDIRSITASCLLDTETPISLYLKIRGISPYSFLLESVEEGNNIGRFSIVGWGKVRSLKAYENKLLINDKESTEKKLFVALDRLVSDYSSAETDIFNGFFGYLGYESVYEIEPSISGRPLYGSLPLAYFFMPRTIAVFDKLSHEVKFTFNLEINEKDIDIEKEIDNVLSGMFTTKRFLSKSADTVLSSDISSNFTEETFGDIVKKAKEYIYSGDIFQVVLSQRFEADYSGDPFEIYRHLCSLNPSPYMFYFNFASEFYLLGTSPEIMLKKQGERLTLRPIAGTRKRAATPEEDLRVEQELLGDEKENAEHLMLVDLGRNDLNRVCLSDSIQVNGYKMIERYSHVMHIVSNINGHMLPDKTGVSAVKAVFPAGTLTGAPKVRAMQIIRELENNPRQMYGGLVGYFNSQGDFDSCITIRSIMVRDKKAYFQAGAGIVADSDPAFEYQETLSKARAMLKAISLSKE
ncbi:MAG: chorismate-binding protein [Candidatus Margulisbacteria bacterium]|nr:chorismate-binding protein [Candidatus Margulisiibacteriota bacterium]